jgi:peptidoglycan hydrolase CwlO-like protein
MIFEKDISHGEANEIQGLEKDIVKLKAQLAELQRENAELQKAVDELTAESNGYFKALLEIRNVSGRAVILEERGEAAGGGGEQTNTQ